MTFCCCYRRRLISSISPACLFLPIISISPLFYRLRNRSPFIRVLCACSVVLDIMAEGETRKPRTLVLCFDG